MNALTRLGHGLTSLFRPASGQNMEIAQAVTIALQEAIARHPNAGGPIIVIGSLTVNVQMNHASGGGATVNARA